MPNSKKYDRIKKRFKSEIFKEKFVTTLNKQQEEQERKEYIHEHIDEIVSKTLEDKFDQALIDAKEYRDRYNGKDYVTQSRIMLRKTFEDLCRTVGMLGYLIYATPLEQDEEFELLTSSLAEMEMRTIQEFIGKRSNVYLAELCGEILREELTEDMITGNKGVWLNKFEHWLNWKKAEGFEEHSGEFDYLSNEEIRQWRQNKEKDIHLF